ncbi:MAG: 16S rRNA (cytosine(1402)-N(4))-methyltransferase RsmH [Actinomycetia bacterium]|nr:16S rRNA (cytosine(1402)-N(4))-methyltransferase RsmH [Actinomycetes bacterium]
MDQPTASSNDREYHKPVMITEVVEWLSSAANGWIVDGTFGGGGHSRALLDRYPNVRIVGVDRDTDALARGTTSDRLRLVRANYRDLASILGTDGIPAQVDGVLLDLGVSSHQLDETDRGFSYHRSGPLDMRMGADAERTAADIVNTSDEAELARILATYGEERFARRIAHAIVQERPFHDTVSLAASIAEAVPAPARRSGHPARKSFQALRIAVNDELDGLRAVMAEVFGFLNDGGRVVVMSYHSLEDRIVKRAIRDRARGCTCPPDLPICTCGSNPDVRELTRKAVRPSAEEIATNPRSRSAVLRVAEKVDL